MHLAQRIEGAGGANHNHRPEFIQGRNKVGQFFIQVAEQRVFLGFQDGIMVLKEFDQALPAHLKASLPKGCFLVGHDHLYASTPYVNNQGRVCINRYRVQDTVGDVIGFLLARNNVNTNPGLLPNLLGYGSAIAGIAKGARGNSLNPVHLPQLEFSGKLPKSRDGALCTLCRNEALVDTACTHFYGQAVAVQNVISTRVLLGYQQMKGIGAQVDYGQSLHAER